MNREELIDMIQYHASNLRNSERMRSRSGLGWRDLWTPSEDDLSLYTTEALQKMHEETWQSQPLLKDNWQEPEMFLPDAEEIRREIKARYDSINAEEATQEPISDRDAMLAYLGPSTLGKYSAEV